MMKMLHKLGMKGNLLNVILERKILETHIPITI